MQQLLKLYNLTGNQQERITDSNSGITLLAKNVDTPTDIHNTNNPCTNLTLMSNYVDFCLSVSIPERKKPTS